MRTFVCVFLVGLLLAAIGADDVRVDNSDQQFVDSLSDLMSESDASPAPATPAAAAPTTATSTPGESFCARVIDMVNLVRTKPNDFATMLQQYTNAGQWTSHPSCSDGDDPKCMFTRSDDVKFLTHDGLRGIQAAISFLQEQQKKGPVPALRVQDGLCKAANDLVQEQGPAGEIGHVGPMGSSILTRVAAQGKFTADISEVVQYGSFLGDGTNESGPFDIVAQLVVGDGDATKAHRSELLKPTWTDSGAEIGNHITYGKMSCILFTDGFAAHK